MRFDVGARGAVHALADGTGGQAAGEVASATSSAAASTTRGDTWMSGLLAGESWNRSPLISWARRRTVSRPMQPSWRRNRPIDSIAPHQSLACAKRALDSAPAECPSAKPASIDGRRFFSCRGPRCLSVQRSPRSTGVSTPRPMRSRMAVLVTSGTPRSDRDALDVLHEALHGRPQQFSPASSATSPASCTGVRALDLLLREEPRLGNTVVEQRPMACRDFPSSALVAPAPIVPTATE